MLECDGEGEFHASRTRLKSKLSFQDILSLKQRNSNCAVHHYFKSEVLSSMQKKTKNENHCSINANNITVSIKMASTIPRKLEKV